MDEGTGLRIHDLLSEGQLTINDARRLMLTDLDPEIREWIITMLERNALERHDTAAQKWAVAVRQGLLRPVPCSPA